MEYVVSSGSKNKMLPMPSLFNVVYLNFFDGALTHSEQNDLDFYVKYGRLFFNGNTLQSFYWNIFFH